MHRGEEHYDDYGNPPRSWAPIGALRMPRVAITLTTTTPTADASGSGVNGK
jgi:hypothetical protein